MDLDQLGDVPTAFCAEKMGPTYPAIFLRVLGEMKAMSYQAEKRWVSWFTTRRPKIYGGYSGE